MAALQPAPQIAAFGITKTGPGTLLLANNPNGANAIANAGSAYIGATRVNQGTLQLGASNLIPAASPIVLGGGKMDTMGLSQAFNTLNVAAPSGIDLGAGSAIVTFANSSAVPWSAGGTLSVLNWTGTPGAGGGTDQVIFGHQQRIDQQPTEPGPFPGLQRGHDQKQR